MLFRLLLTAWISILLAAVEVVLQDGQILKGVEARREGDIYLIQQDSGEVLTVPVELVREVRLIGEKPPPAEPPRSGVVVNESRQLAGTPTDREGAGPTGLVRGAPQTLAGGEVRSPSRSEQLEALGPPAQFQKGVSDPYWHPKPAFDPNEDVLADSRSKWQDSVIDNEWQPESAFDSKQDVLASGRSGWQQGVVDNSWQPEDDFKKSSAW